MKLEIKLCTLLRISSRGGCSELSNLFVSILIEICRFVEDPNNPNPTPPISSAMQGAISTDKYYIAQIHNMSATESCTLYLDFSHLRYWSDTHVKGLAEAVTERHYRFLPFLRRGLEACIRKYEPEYWGKTGRQLGTGEGVSCGRLIWRSPILTRNRLHHRPTRCSA
jgi:DNA replication licensing factor MCM6